jgi:hypothetical protein
MNVAAAVPACGLKNLAQLGAEVISCRYNQEIAVAAGKLTEPHRDLWN